MSRNLRSRGITTDPIDDTHTITRAVQMSAEDYAEFQAFQTHRQQASLSFKIQGPAKHSTPILKTEDTISYKGEISKELNNFLYECERQFDVKGFRRKRIVRASRRPISLQGIPVAVS